MDKRRFRPAAGCSEDKRPDYPTLEQFDERRRTFLARLCGLFGASALAPLLAHCGGRAVDLQPEPSPAERDPLPSARADGGADLKPEPSVGGGATMPPARADASVDLRPEPPLSGDAPLPPARADASVDLQPEPPLAGGAPLPPARGDGGSCPVP